MNNKYNYQYKKYHRIWAATCIQTRYRQYQLHKILPHTQKYIKQIYIQLGHLYTLIENAGGTIPIQLHTQIELQLLQTLITSNTQQHSMGI